MLAGVLLLWAWKGFAQGKEDIPPAPTGDEYEEAGDEPVREFGAPVQELPPNARVEDIVEPSAEYHYAGFGRPDPFQPPVEIQAVVADTVEIPIVSPLQRYPLKELRLVGVWARNNGERKALVLTPVNEGIIVKVGDPVGNGGGKVISISDSSMVVREFLLAEDGTRQFSDSRIVFETKPEAAVAPRGSIVITPGASQPQVVVPGEGAQVPGAAAGNAAPAAPPANQVPASGLAGIAGTPSKPANSPSPTPQATAAPTTPKPLATPVPVKGSPFQNL